MAVGDNGSPATPDRRAPRFAVIVSAGNAGPGSLRSCLRSIVDQTFDGWDLIIVRGADSAPRIRDLLESVGLDRSTTVIDVNEGIEPGGSPILDRVGGDFCVLLSGYDRLSPDALGAFAAELMRFDDVDLAYCDHDRIDPATGVRSEPFFKPSFSMERLRCQMYLGRPLVVRAETARDVGGLAPMPWEVQHHDLALRVAERARRVLHLPRLLGHLPGSTSAAAYDVADRVTADRVTAARVAAVQDHLVRTGFPARVVERSDAPGVLHLHPALTFHPRVSIIIPTGGSRRRIHGLDTLLVERSVASIVKRTTYPDYELVVVVSSQSDPSLERSIVEAAGPAALTVVHDDQPFNFARACNLGAVRSQGDTLVFLNDDTEVVMDGWLERMVMYAGRPDIGAVGVKLLYGDGRIQHAGVWSRAGGPAHRYVGFAGDHPGNAQALNVAQNCLAVTAACLAVDRSKFEQVGGFSQLYPLAYNDVDLCLKLHRLGYRNVVDCATEVVHHESCSRDPTVRQWEFDQLFRRWRRLLTADPFDNPCNLAAGVDEYPPTPIEVVEDKAYRDHDLVLVGRSSVLHRPPAPQPLEHS